ncbi:SsrA-binding protein SmpB [Enterobacteriaceae endosymbiont of Donacia provostii]|uniref:SsrA-binding protein SmpB n=1 Tax=Enterobacteriaceae endosymbiont of Donacia provostii TaxID=2675781 RepID=UPI0014495481|nr:SsrA-binding protein SmpB [Enterobacteriaceae endosymbiont of Donacia provostii]QJC33851.1 SsrA-binding protein SmpB [Enterobacteriaceae endosymbiont of Donacia provostii]
MIEKKFFIFNKKVYNNFFIKERFDAGLILKGWEVKSLRFNKGTIINSYITIINKKIYLYNFDINPLKTVCSHINFNSKRIKQLLLKKKEINLLQNYINSQGFTIVVIGLFWKKSLCKANIAVVKGKKKYDKRNLLKKKIWNIKKIRLLKKNI